jgi:hypothetical protein
MLLASVVPSAISVLPASAQVTTVTNPTGSVRMVRGGTVTTTSSVNFVDVPGAATTINIPAGTRAVLRARFIAESACSGGGAVSNYCRIRILINNVEAQPAVGFDFAFDSTNNGNETSSSWESHAVERSSATILPAGNYVVKVQQSTSSAGVTFRLDDWHLSVERL